LATVALALAISSAVGIAPAVAQRSGDPLTKFLDGIFRKDATQGRETAPANAEPGAMSAPSPATVAPPSVASKAVPAPAERTRPPNAKRDAAGPASVAPNAKHAAVAPVPQGVTEAAAPLPDTPTAALARINAHFNGIDTMTATFVQSTDGAQIRKGTMAIKRPGWLQFVYESPSSLEIVSDGKSLAVRDKALGTNDVYPVNQTPMKFLVQEKFDLASDTKVNDVRIGKDGLIIVDFDARSTFGGSSRIQLVFDATADRLQQWTVTDTQGFRTTVILANVAVVPRLVAVR
jgi:outer membrane lipoprotein-sorting protein